MKEKVRRHIEIAHLISKFMCNQLDDAGKKTLKNWLEQKPMNKTKCRDYIEEAIIKQNESPYADEKEWNEFAKRYNIGSKKNIFKPWMKYAAAVFVIFGAVILYSRIQTISDDNVSKPAVQLAKHVPLLTLPSGNIVPLNQSNSRMLIVDSNHNILYQKGNIVYESSSQNSGENIEYNTMSVPACCEYSLRLEDGTSIRLNAGTSLKFPSYFSEAKREVWLSGEAFFEVSKQNGKPFIVHTDKGDINVLGTTFNISAYQNEDCKATLVKGSIEYVLGNCSKILTPGMQAIVKEGSDQIGIHIIDINTAIAWTNGKFYFKEEPLEQILNTLGKWYGCDIDYNNTIAKSLRFTVETDRYNQIDNILEMISETGKVKVEKVGNTIIVK